MIESFQNDSEPITMDDLDVEPKFDPTYTEDYTESDFSTNSPFFVGDFKDENINPKIDVVPGRGITINDSYEAGSDKQMDLRPVIRNKLSGDVTLVQTFDIREDETRRHFYLGGIGFKSGIPNIPGSKAIQEHINIDLKNMRYDARKLTSELFESADADSKVKKAGIGEGFKKFYFKPLDNEEYTYSPVPVSFLMDGKISLIRILFRKRNDERKYDIIVKVFVNKYISRGHLVIEGEENKYDFGQGLFTYNTMVGMDAQTEKVSKNYIFSYIRLSIYGNQLSIYTRHKKDNNGRHYSSIVGEYKNVPLPEADYITTEWDGTLKFYLVVDRATKTPTTLVAGWVKKGREYSLEGKWTNSKGVDFEYSEDFEPNDDYSSNKKNIFLSGITNQIAYTFNASSDKPIIKTFLNGDFVGEYIIDEKLPFSYEFNSLIMNSRYAWSRAGDIYDSSIANRGFSVYDKQLLSPDLKGIYYSNLSETEKLELCGKTVDRNMNYHAGDNVLNDERMETVKGHRDDIQNTRIIEKTKVEDKLESEEYNARRKVHLVKKDKKKYKTINKVLIGILIGLILVILIRIAMNNEKVRIYVSDKYDNVRNALKSKTNQFRKYNEAIPTSLPRWAR